MPHEEPSERRGRIITFYSYKGGVGRSMALANVAALLVGSGQRVLVVDWDLEAPGLERFFESDDHGTRGVALAEARARTPGVVDLIKAFEAGRPIPWRQCVIHAQLVEGRRPLSLISAGRDDPGYAPSVRSIDWAELFDALDLGEYLEELRTAWLRDFDFILIDSRTGLTDSGGVCTIHLPDVVVALFTASGQSIAGIKSVLREASHAHQRLPVDRSRLQLVPVPARDESQAEYEIARKWREIFARELGEFYVSWLPGGVTARQVLERLKIPYKAYWSYGERLPVLHEGTSDPAGLGYAYAVLAGLLETNLDWLAAPEAAAMRALPSQRPGVRGVRRVTERTLRVVPRVLTWVLAGFGTWFLLQTWWTGARAESNVRRVEAAIAATRERPRPGTRLDEAERRRRAGDSEVARAIYDELIAQLDGMTREGESSAPALGADNSRLLYRAYLGRGKIRVSSDLEGAVRDFSRASELAVDGHDRAEALWRRADAVELSGQPAAALNDLSSVASLVPEEAFGLFARAEIEASRGDFDEATDHYRAALDAASGDAGPSELGQLVARAHYALGEGLRNAGNLADAADEYTLAVRAYESQRDRSARLWRARYARGVVLRLLGRPEAALADFQAVAQQDASPALRANALSVMEELGITRVKLFYSRATDKNGAQELALKINDIGRFNVADVTLSTVPTVAEVRYRVPQQKEMATALAAQLDAWLRRQYGAVSQVNVRLIDAYPADSDRNAIEAVLPALTSTQSPLVPAAAPSSGKRSYLEIAQEDLTRTERARAWVANADRSEAYGWVIVASRPTIEQAFEEYERWSANAATKGAPGVELDVQLKYASNYWYAVAVQAHDEAHQRAIVQWAKEWEPATFAKATTFPVEIVTRPVGPARKASPVFRTRKDGSD